jgi:hypothetical protein
LTKPDRKNSGNWFSFSTRELIGRDAGLRGSSISQAI